MPMPSSLLLENFTHALPPLPGLLATAPTCHPPSTPASSLYIPTSVHHAWRTDPDDRGKDSEGGGEGGREGREGTAHRRRQKTSSVDMAKQARHLCVSCLHHHYHLLLSQAGACYTATHARWRTPILSLSLPAMYVENRRSHFGCGAWRTGVAVAVVTVSGRALCRVWMVVVPAPRRCCLPPSPTPSPTDGNSIPSPCWNHSHLACMAFSSIGMTCAGGGDAPVFCICQSVSMTHSPVGFI